MIDRIHAIQLRTAKNMYLVNIAIDKWPLGVVDKVAIATLILQDSLADIIYEEISGEKL